MSLQQLQSIEKLINAGQFFEAEVLCEKLANSQGYSDPASQALTYIYIQTNRPEMAISLLKKRLKNKPSNRQDCDTLANLHGQLGHFQQAANCYRQYLQREPNDPDALFNFAYNLKRNGQFQLAVDNYFLALDFGISQPEEVFLNIAVIYVDYLHQESLAKELLSRALEINYKYVPALFNLANLLEQEGKKEQALKLFKQVIEIEPKHGAALARIADLIKFEDKADPIIEALQLAISHAGTNKSIKIDLLFGLGKALNDCKDYSRAFIYYNQANKLSQSFIKPYEKQNVEDLTDTIIQTFSSEWFAQSHSCSKYQPIFICGMFRSGSTLVEQILASHPAITAGGELDFFVRKVAGELAPFPNTIASLSANSFEELAVQYQNYLKQLFPDAGFITDKRPDNFLYVGLIKTLFPYAKIILTKRQILDNCLSVFFQHLGESMNYATSLENTAHYYMQQNSLMKHWKHLFPDTLFEVNYDKLIAEPENVVRRLLGYLELDWSPRCLEFYNADNYVKTASVLQVRNPLYSSSSGRWKNYAGEVANLKAYIDNELPE